MSDACGRVRTHVRPPEPLRNRIWFCARTRPPHALSALSSCFRCITLRDSDAETISMSVIDFSVDVIEDAIVDTTILDHGFGFMITPQLVSGSDTVVMCPNSDECFDPLADCPDVRPIEVRSVGRATSKVRLNSYLRGVALCSLCARNGSRKTACSMRCATR